MTTYRWSTFAMASLGALAFTFGGAGSASAGLFHHGSSGSYGGYGGSSGSYGGYGGSSGSYGGYGGSSGSYGGYGGSSGSYGGYGGSSGSYGGYGGSSGSWGSYGGSYGSYGSYGGGYGGGYGGMYGGGMYGGGMYGGGMYGGGMMGGYGFSSNAGNDKVPANTRVAYLNVKVPADARVYLQDQRMTLTGTQRRFVTPELAQGQHVYNVRVEVVRNGKTLTKTAKALVTAGQEVEVAVSFDETTNARVAAVAPASSR